MGCFIAPVTEAIAVTIIKKAISKKVVSQNSDGTINVSVEFKYDNPFLKRIDWLSKMLWGGSALLAFEHVWHGEVVAWFPFLTAMETPESTSEMLAEISTVGVSMAVLITAVWVGLVFIAKSIEKRPQVLARGKTL